MTTRRAWIACAMAGFAGSLACTPSVSDHDNRIFAMAASVKLSSGELSSAYKASASNADGRYQGRVVEISGVVRGIRPEAAVVTLAGAEDGPAIEASIHDDVSAQVLKTMADGQRITLKCFCEGLTEQVRLKSCVTPDAGR